MNYKLGIFKKFPNHKFIINLLQYYAVERDSFASRSVANLGELVLIEKNIIPKFKP